MKKILKIFSTVVIFLFVLSLFGWTVYQISNKNKEFGFLTKPIRFMYTFPDLFSQSVDEVKTLPRTFIPTPKNFKPINKLKQDVNAIVTYTNAKKSRAIVLMNLKNDSIIKKWTIENPDIEESRILNPILLEDGSLIYGYDFKWSGMRRIDSSGNQIWKQNKIVLHHGMELGSDGNIWACTKERVGYATGMYRLKGRTVFYVDYTISKIDVETGEILFHKSISEILKENKLANHLIKSPQATDPIHLNDVQPALKTTEYYQEDDVFISLRNLSCIIHYRPSTNKIINYIEGPFVSQHDVDFLNNHTLAIFNNNYYVRRTEETHKPPKDSILLVNAGDFYSHIVTYDFRDGSFSYIGESVFRNHRIYTETEGLMEFIDSTTYFVEEQNPGLLWIIKDDKVIYKNVLKSQHKGHHHLPNWTRIIKNKQYD